MIYTYLHVRMVLIERLVYIFTFVYPLFRTIQKKRKQVVIATKPLHST